MTMSADLIARINAEMLRAMRLQEQGKFSKTCREGSDTMNTLVVLEEFVEAIDDYRIGKDPTEEIIQIIACLVAWTQRVGNPYVEFPEHAQPENVAIIHHLCALGRRARIALDTYEEEVKTGAVSHT